jgi:hypothetical protein
MASYESIFESIKALEAPEQRRLLDDLLKHLLGKPPKSHKAGASEGASTGSWWTEATKWASEILKPLREAENERLTAEGMKKLPGTCSASILSALKTAGKLSKEARPSEKELEEAFHAWVRTNHKAETASAASAGTKGTTKTKFSDLSPEEQKAKRSEAAKKAAATRAANKAKAAGGAPAEASDSEDEEEAPPAPAEGPVLKPLKVGLKTYKSFVHEDITHLFSNDDAETWMGTLQGKKVVKEGYENPFEEDD